MVMVSMQLNTSNLNTNNSNSKNNNINSFAMFLTKQQAHQVRVSLILNSLPLSLTCQLPVPSCDSPSGVETSQATLRPHLYF